MPLLSLLSHRDHLPPPTPLFSLSIPWVSTHTVASDVGDVFSGALSLLFPLSTPPSSLSSLRVHLSLLTPPPLPPIPQARHCDAATSTVVSKSSPPVSTSPSPRTRRLLLVLRPRRQFCRPISERLLNFGLLTSYLVWWRFALVTVGRAIPHYLVWYRYCWKKLRCKLNTQGI